MKATKIVALVFGIVGIGMLVGGFFLFNHTRSFIKRSSATTGTVIKLVQERSSTSRGRGRTSSGYVYHPVIRFETESGQTIEFKSSCGTNPPSYHVDDKALILYDPGNPYKATINSFGSLWAGCITLFALGVGFAAVGSIMLAVGARWKQRVEWLKQFGRKIMTDFKGVELNTSVRMNGRSPYRIVSQWHDPASNEVYVFKSENIWFDPEQYIEKDRGIEVYIDPNNPKKYHVDTSFLPEVAD